MSSSHEDRIRQRLNNRETKLKEAYLASNPELVEEVQEGVVNARQNFFEDTIKIRVEQQQPEYISDYTRQERKEMIEERLEEAGKYEEIRDAMDGLVDEDWLIRMASQYRAPDRRAQDRQRLLQEISIMLAEKDFSYDPPEDPDIVLNGHDEVVYRLCDIAEEEGLDATSEIDVLYDAIRDVFPERHDYEQACLSLEQTKNVIPRLNDLEEDPAAGASAIRFVEGLESSFVQAFRPLVELKADRIYGEELEGSS